MENNMMKFTLLSIDAWRDDCNWVWDNWYKIEDDIFIDEKLTKSNRFILKFLRKSGFLTENSKGKLAIDDDGYNLTIINKNTHEPILALCYGMHHEFNEL